MKKKSLPKDLTEADIKKLDIDLSAMMAAEVRKEIDNAIVESVISGKPSGITFTETPDTPEWRQWHRNRAKIADYGDKLLKKYENK